jgi:hypothetical protein
MATRREREDTPFVLRAQVANFVFWRDMSDSGVGAWGAGGWISA